MSQEIDLLQVNKLRGKDSFPIPTTVIFEDLHGETERFKSQAVTSCLKVVYQSEGDIRFIYIATSLGKDEGINYSLQSTHKNGLEIITKYIFKKGKAIHVYARPATLTDLHIVACALNEAISLVDN